MFSFTGDTVLDPFVGTGSTMLAALKCHRNSIGNELDPAYFAMAEKRLKAEIDQTPMFGEGPRLVMRQSAPHRRR